MERRAERPVIGLALGSGAARGWAHIGVFEALGELGIRPQVVAGTSVGAVVGAAWACGRLDPFSAWVRGLSWWDVVRHAALRPASGGFIDDERLLANLGRQIPDQPIESLPIPFCALATELTSGREVWLQEGSLLQAIRASIALPGLFPPVCRDGQWLLDGGLVNPVPVSVCRALGAELVIAVNLNDNLAGRHFKPHRTRSGQKQGKGGLLEQLMERFGQRVDSLYAADEESSPGLFDVLAGSVNIMQERITRSRMAGDPPDLMLTPRLSQIGLLEFDRAEEAIEEGRRSVLRMESPLRELLDR